MWLWGLLGWCVASIAVAALCHRLRRVQRTYPPEVAAFLLRLETELAERHPGVQFLGMLPDRFACLLLIEGQETPVGLHDAYRLAEAHPEAFPRIVEQLLRDVQAVGIDRVEDVDFVDAAPRLLPQVRSLCWLDQRGRFGDSGLVHRRLNDELVVVYVLDDPHCMVFVCRAHLRQWRKSELDVHNLALANLERLGAQGVQAAANGKQPLLLQSGDGYDAARVLLLERTEGLLVAIPDRDMLWVARESGQNLEQLMATAAEIAGQASHPVSPHLWRVKDGRLQAVTATR